MKKFLLITYYWPPAGGAGVMRWAKMSKYFDGTGWQPVVYTPENGEIPVVDESLAKEIPPTVEVVRRPIWEPYDLYKTFLGRKKKDKLYSGFINEKKKASLTQKVAIFIRGNFFIPDARMFWIKPSVQFLKAYLQTHPVDAIISTGPPHSMHMIGEKVHRATGIPWIADFRDPWTNIDFYHELKLTKAADMRHKSMEKKVLKTATRIVTVTWRSRDEFEQLSGRKDIVVIPNGFDDADFNQYEFTLDRKFSIVHIGSMNKDRDPVALWQALRSLIDSSDEFAANVVVKLVGPVDFAIRESIRKTGLESYVQFFDFVPHVEAVRLQQQAQVLLLMINNTPNAKTIIPGKLYEYLGAGRPIMAIGPAESDSAKVIEMTKGGVVHGFDDVEGIKSQLLKWFAEYQSGQLQGGAEGIKRFTRRSLAGEFARLLNEVTAKREP